MIYKYKSKTYAQLEKIAEVVVGLFPQRRKGLSVDIEGILEDLGLDLLPRRDFRQYAEGYLARDPRVIVIDESILSYMRRARFTIAEEVCHLILEYKLWENGSIPEGARSHELSEGQHYTVERNAKNLASAILMPKEDFRVAFHAKAREIESMEVSGNTAVRLVLENMKEEFYVSNQAAFYRARNLDLIDHKSR